MKIFILCATLLLISCYCPAQNQHTIDSLQTVLASNVSDKQKADVYNLMAREYCRYDSAQVARYAAEAIRIAKKINYPAGLCNAWYWLGWITMIKGYYPKALELYNRTLQTAKKAGYKKGISYAYNGIGQAWTYRSNYPKALEAYQQSLKVREQMKDKRGIADSYNDIGEVYHLQGNYPKALKFFQRSLETTKQTRKKSGMAMSYNNIGLIYQKQGKLPKALEFYQRSLKINEQLGDKWWEALNYHNMGDIYHLLDNYPKALEFHQRSLSIKQQTGDKEGIANSYNNIGLIYRTQNNYAKALEFLQKSLKINTQIGNKSSIASSNLNLGKLALDQKQYTKAKTYFEKALALRQEMGEEAMSAEAWINLGIAYYIQKKHTQALVHLKKGMAMTLRTGSPRIVKEGAEYLSKVYETTGNLKKALENHKLFKKMADSLLNAQNIRQTTRLGDKYIAKKREDSLRLIQTRKDALHKADIKQRQLTQGTTYLGLGLSLVLMLVLLFFYRSKQRSNQKLNTAYEELNQFNEELQTANDSIHIAHKEIKTVNESLEQKNKDITASITYARRIQQATLPLDETMKKYLPEHFVMFRPHDIVSGDFYWFDQSNGKTFIVAADCTGHGVPGAFMTMLGAQALNNIIVQNKIHTPGKVLERLDKMLRETLKTENTMVRDGMDMVMVVIDQQNRKLHYAGAKIPLILVQNHQVQEIRGNIHSINGYHPKNKPVEFTTHTFDLLSPTTFYMYSDGYQDQFGGEHNKKFMKKRLRELVFEISEKPMMEQRQILENTLNKWMDGREQMDDILVMGIRT